MSKYHAKNIKAYDAKAQNYDNTLDGKFTAKFKELLVANMSLAEGSRVLDVGCGNGRLLAKIAEKWHIEGFGVDISPNMVASAGARYPEFEFAVAGCDDLSFGERSMDVLTACCTYHHFPDVAAFTLEAKRVLRPGGSIYIADVYLPPVIRQTANVFLPLSKDGDVKFYSTGEIAGTFERAGFELVSVVRNGHMQVVRLRG